MAKVKSRARQLDHAHKQGGYTPVVDAVILNFPFWTRLRAAFAGRMDGEFRWRVRPLTASRGLKLDIGESNE